MENFSRLRFRIALWFWAGWVVWLGWMILLGWGNCLEAGEPYQTTGGLFIYQDVKFFGEWRIQQNVWTGGFRLLDPQSVCYAEGSREACEAFWEKIRAERNIPPMSGRVLVFMHGFGSNRLMLQNLANWFRREGDYSAIINITYPSTMVGVLEESARVREIVAGLEGAEKIDFVGHSMGAIILRHYLSHDPDTRVGRFVQLCPPNQGSQQAMDTKGGVLAPSALNDLGLDPLEMQERYGTPQCQIGIISGGTGTEEGFTDALDKDDDYVISVCDTYLNWSTDWTMIPATHSEVPNTLETFQLVKKFMNEGKF